LRPEVTELAVHCSVIMQCLCPFLLHIASDVGETMVEPAECMRPAGSEAQASNVKSPSSSGMQRAAAPAVAHPCSYPGHIAHPSCPAPWSPLSPSACQHVSPHMAAHCFRFANKEHRQALHSLPAQRPFLSAVPMGMYPMTVGSMPETSSHHRPRFVSAHQSQNMGSLKGVQGMQQPSAMPVLQFGSPAMSDASSRHGNQLSPCILQPRLSPRVTDVTGSASQMFSCQPGDFSSGEVSNWHPPPVLKRKRSCLCIFHDHLAQFSLFSPVGTLPPACILCHTYCGTCRF
jgi:hypothetical protein